MRANRSDYKLMAELANELADLPSSAQPMQIYARHNQAWLACGSIINLDFRAR